MIKRFFIILGIALSILLVGLFFSYDYWIEKELKYQLSEIINKDPNSLYQYRFKKLNVDLFDGSVDITGIKIEPKPAAFDSLVSDSTRVRFLIDLNLDEIDLYGFEIMEFLNTGKIIVESVNLDQPTFLYYFNPLKSADNQTMPLTDIFSDEFKSANIIQFNINDGQVQIDNYLTEDPALFINYLNVRLTDTYIDRQTITRINPFEYEDVSLAAGSISADISKNYSIESDSLSFDALDESFIIRDFQIKPKYDMQSWAKLYDYQKQWFALKFGSVSLRNIDIEHFINTGEIKVGRIRVREPKVALYKDKTKPEPPFKKKPLPVTAINSIPLKINIDSVHVMDGYMTIQETSKLTGLDSHISFYDLNGTVTNFTNFPQEQRNSDVMELHASTLMYKKAPIKLYMLFDLNSTEDYFEAIGSVDSVDMVTFNPVLEPMMAAKVTDGKLHKMIFGFTATDSLSKGVLDMEYSDVKIDIINVDTTNDKQRKGFLSFAANTIINTQNRKSTPSYVQGIIHTERVLNKDVWPYLWHSVQSGLVSTLAPIATSKEIRHQQKIYRQELKKERQESKD